MRAFSSCTSGGHCWLQCTGFSLWWLLLLQSTSSKHIRFSSCSTQTQQLRCASSRVPRLTSCGTWALEGGSILAVQGLLHGHVESSRTKDQTRIPCTGKRILIHSIAKEVPKYYDFKNVSLKPRPSHKLGSHPCMPFMKQNSKLPSNLIKIIF